MDFWIALFSLIVLVPLAFAGASMAPWVPTRARDVERFLDIVEMPAHATFLEIGCGDGRISRALARKFPNNTIIGVELAFPMYLTTWLKNRFSPLKNFSLVFGDAFKHDFSHYDVIYVYGMPDKMQKKIVPKFLAEAKSGASLYSYVFSIPEDFRDEQVTSFGGENEAKIHRIIKS